MTAGNRTDKLPIFDPSDQAALLGICETDNEYIPVWLMMRCGMHPSDVAAASAKLSWNGHFIEWERVKNQVRRREMVPLMLENRLKHWLKHGRKLTREGYWHLVKRLGSDLGHPEYSPMTLRHTFAINELRRYNDMKNPPPDPFKLVAIKMGCTEDTVRRFYIDLEAWERLGKE